MPESSADLHAKLGRFVPLLHGEVMFVFFFFFSSRRRHTRCSRDWSSDVCSSDLQDFRRAISTDAAAGSTAVTSLSPWARRQARVPVPHPKSRTDWASSSSARRSEERRVGKECRSRWSPYH